MAFWFWFGPLSLCPLIILYIFSGADWQAAPYKSSANNSMPFLPADTAIKNVVVLGASYVGIGAAQKLAATLPEDFQVILIEPNSHFMHLFAFPRFAVLPSHEHKVSPTKAIVNLQFLATDKDPDRHSSH